MEKDIFLVFNEKVAKKNLRWEISSTIGKYDNIYKIEFKTINDQGAVQGIRRFLDSHYFVFI